MKTGYVSLFYTAVFCHVAYGGVSGVKRIPRADEGQVDEVFNQPPDLYIVQPLDHFDITNKGVWKQRFRVNDTWFNYNSNAESPIFLIINDGDNASWLIRGAWMEYAQQFNALCFQLEHRFYGKSRPTEDLSVGNLKYLSSRQALSDIAYFIYGMNQKYKLISGKNKWIIFGGGYRGSLAAWVRLKYPHLVHAAVASSAPLTAKADFSEFNEALRSRFAISSEMCAKNIHQAALDVEVLLKTSEGANTVSRKFNVCETLDRKNNNDLANFIDTLFDGFRSLVEYMDMPESLKVDDVCSGMANSSYGTLIDRYALVTNLLRESKGCIPASYNVYIDRLRNVSYTDDRRQWIYQACTEFGHFPTSSTPKEMFGSSLDIQYYIDRCRDVFGEDFDVYRLYRGMKKTNNFYGGLNIQVSRVAFIQGSLDPWRSLGINNSNNSLINSIVIDGIGHCGDMFPSRPTDPPQLTQARKRIENLISQWIGT